MVHFSEFLDEWKCQKNSAYLKHKYYKCVYCHFLTVPKLSGSVSTVYTVSQN